jgi:3'-phosphoadenosine 5'-phosphosulfate sulfotransferase (PAPS reductase)/FAD synthetase
VAALEADCIRIAKALKNEPLLLMFSTGKDSIVACDLMFKHHEGPKTLVFLYFVDGLEIKERVLRFYEDRWNTKIIRRPSADSLKMLTGKKIKLSDIEAGLRKEFNATWTVWGIRRSDSMQRMAIIGKTDRGIDERNRKLYPIGWWKPSEVYSYCKFNKLVLPIEYQHGFKRDFSNPDGDALIYLRNTFPNDYKKVIEKFPICEQMVWKVENGC